MFENQTPVSCTESACRQHILLSFETIELHADTGCHTDPAGQHECKQKGGEDADFLSKMQLEERCDDHERHIVQHIADTLHDHVNCAAVVAFNCAVNAANEEVDRRNDNGEQEAQTSAGSKADENVLTISVGAEEEGGNLTVEITEVFVIIHTQAITALVFGSIGVPFVSGFSAVVAFNTKTVIVCTVRIVDDQIIGDRIAAFIQNRCTG